MDALFRNRTNTQREFDLKSQDNFIPKLHLLGTITALLNSFEVTKSSRSNTGFFSLHKYFVDPVKIFAKVVSEIV